MQHTAQQSPYNILLIEGDAAQLRITADMVEEQIQRQAGSQSPYTFILTTAVCLSDAQASISETSPAVILVDMESVAGIGGVEALTTAAPYAKLISLSGKGALSTAIDAMRAGAWDFLIKPLGKSTLQKRIAEATSAFRKDMKRRDASQPVSIAQSIVASVPPASMTTLASPDETSREFEGFCGTSACMTGLYKQIERIAPSAAPVFITGESGTGKEVCAEALHNRSGRGSKPFVAINCSAIPKDLMESELFGHCKGAFTGAVEDHPGAAEQADGGTLFLDEIGDMDLALQAKLLRFIQTGTVRRIGDVQVRNVNVRIICATHRDPQKAVTDGRFREDLFYRLHVLPISVPPLRTRQTDVLSLANKFLETFATEENRKFKGFSAQAEACLSHYHWPGNVRELQNVVRHTVVMNDGVSVDIDMLPDTVKSSAMVQTSDALAIDMAGLSSDRTPSASRSSQNFDCLPFWQQEQSIIETALMRYGGNISRAAAALEISPSTIYRKRQAWMSKVEDLPSARAI